MPFDEAYKMKIKSEDEKMWMHNQYTYIAVLSGISKIFSGKKSKCEYPSKPLLHEYYKQEEEENITEEQKQVEIDNLMNSLKLMQISFESNHKKQ